MAIKKIEYINKLATEELLDIPEENKFTADNANEIKDVVNSHADEIQELKDNQLSVNFVEPLKREDNNISIEQTSLDKWNNSLNNEEVQSLINSSLNPIKEELATKQDVLIAGNNITIEDNTISSNVDLTDYYNKSETDEKITQAIEAIPDVDLSGYAKLNDPNQASSGGPDPNTLWANDFRTRKTRFSSYGNGGYVSGDNQLILKDETSGNQLVVGSNLTFKNQEVPTKPYVDSLISPITNDISLIKQEQTTQNQQIQSNRDLSNQIIEGLQNQLRVFTPRGAYNSSTNYMKNDFVSYNQFTFVSLVDNNKGNTPSILQDSQYWMRAGITINSTPEGVATEIWVNNQLQGYLQLDTYNSNMEELRTNLTQQLSNKQDVLIAGNNITIEDNTISSNVDLSNYAQLNESNNGEFFIGDKSGNHIWFAKPFRYGGDTYSSIKIRNGNSNFLTLETNFTDRVSSLASPDGEFRVYNLATPIRDDEATNKKYVDDALLNYYNKSEVDSKFENLSTTPFVNEAPGEIKEWKDESEYQKYLASYGVDDSFFIDYQDPEYALQSDLDIAKRDITVNEGQIESLVQKTTSLDNNLNFLSYDYEGSKNKLNQFFTPSFWTEYKLRNYWSGYKKKIISASGGNLGGTNAAFYVIFTNIFVPKVYRFDLRIETTGEIGNPNGNAWYSGIQLSHYINGDGNIVINLVKWYDSNDDIEYWKDNIYIYLRKNTW